MVVGTCHFDTRFVALQVVVVGMSDAMVVVEAPHREGPREDSHQQPRTVVAVVVGYDTALVIVVVVVVGGDNLVPSTHSLLSC